MCKSYVPVLKRNVPTSSHSSLMILLLGNAWKENIVYSLMASVFVQCS